MENHVDLPSQNCCYFDKRWVPDLSAFGFMQPASSLLWAWDWKTQSVISHSYSPTRILDMIKYSIVYKDSYESIN